jgi:hypothetical protein
MSDFIPAKTGLSRVFVIDGRAAPDNVPEYFSCYRAQALGKPFGDVTDIECPDPTRPGEYIKIGDYQTGEERATITLEGRYAIDIRSRMLRMARNRCAVDVQLHFGDCNDLSDHNNFKKVLFLEDARLTSYNTEDLGSLQSADEAAVNENVEISARHVYDIIPNTWTEKAADLVTNEVVDVVFCDEVSCGDCDVDPSGGCDKVFAITKAAGGSPTTPPDVVYTLDGGTTWYAHDIDSMGASDDPDGVACVKGYLVVVSNATGSAHYADLDEFDEYGTDPDFTEVDTGFGSGEGEPNAIVSLDTKAFIAGNDGYVYEMVTPSNGVTALEDGTATISHLTAIDALSTKFVVAVGNDGAIVYSVDGVNFTLLTTPPVGVGVNLTCISIKSKDEWWVGTDGGDLYYTEDRGEHWTLKTFSGSGAGAVRDIVWATESIMYVSHDTATPVGRVFASYNGGYDFVAMPLGSAIMPAADQFTALAACKADPELVVAVGLADDGSDGIIVIGAM